MLVPAPVLLVRLRAGRVDGEQATSGSCLLTDQNIDEKGLVE